MKKPNPECRPYFLKYLLDRIKKNKNIIVTITGATGSGKSWAALWLADVLSKQQGLSFSADNICFKGSEFLKLVNSDLKKGSCIIFDEAGIEMYSRSWASPINKMLNYLLQTYRYRNLITIFTLPQLTMLDSHARSLTHVWLHHNRDALKYGMVAWKPLLSQVGATKTYWKYLRIRERLEKVTKTSSYVRLWTERPPTALVEAYERKKTSFAGALSKNIEAELLEIENANLHIKETKELTAVQSEVYNQLKSGKSVADVAVALKKTPSYTHRMKKTIISKGYDI